MNMFGLPDEVMDAIMRSAIRSQMSGNSRNPFEKPQEVPKPKEVDTAARAAKSAKGRKRTVCCLSERRIFRSTGI